MNQHEISYWEYKRAIKEKFVQNGLQSIKEVCSLAFEKYETYQKQIYEIAYAKKTRKKVPDDELERNELLAQYRLDEAIKALREARDDVEKILCEAFKTAQSVLAKYIKTLSNPNPKLDSINTHVGDAYEDLKDKVFADLKMRQMNVKMVAGAIKKTAMKEKLVLNEGNVEYDKFIKKKAAMKDICMHLMITSYSLRKAAPNIFRFAGPDMSQFVRFLNDKIPGVIELKRIATMHCELLKLLSQRTEGEKIFMRVARQIDDLVDLFEDTKKQGKMYKNAVLRLNKCRNEHEKLKKNIEEIWRVAETEELGQKLASKMQNKLDSLVESMQREKCESTRHRKTFFHACEKLYEIDGCEIENKAIAGIKEILDQYGKMKNVMKECELILKMMKLSVKEEALDDDEIIPRANPNEVANEIKRLASKAENVQIRNDLESEYRSFKASLQKSKMNRVNSVVDEDEVLPREIRNISTQDFDSQYSQKENKIHKSVSRRKSIIDESTTKLEHYIPQSDAKLFKALSRRESEIVSNLSTGVKLQNEVKMRKNNTIEAKSFKSLVAQHRKMRLKSRSIK